MRLPIATLFVLGLFVISTAWSQSAPMPKLQDFGKGDQPGPPPPAPKAQNGKGYYWSVDEVKKTFAVQTKNVGMGHFAWTPEYRLSIVQRPYATPDKASSEMHEDKTQIYFILSGTGTQILGGTPEKDNITPEGQHNSFGPLKGGVSYKIKPGDMILIPPLTWHQTMPDPGQTVVYQMVHIETRTRIP